MILFISSEDVKSLLDMQDFVESVEDSYWLLGQGAIQMLPRIYVDSENWSGFLKLMPANVGGLSVGSLLVYTSGIHQGVQKVILLFDEPTGALKAGIETNRVSWMRTGAASGLATKYLARRDAKVVGVFGSHRQARSQLLAINAVRKIERAIKKGIGQELNASRDDSLLCFLYSKRKK
jgi:ornithine cyclodeaminase/alanine dehydrogenase-like protein (mu-crystallin family)